MISERSAKKYCSEDISLIENYHKAIADEERMWDIHHRKECDEEGRTLFTKNQLIDMNVYYNRPASELMFVTRSMHKKIHLEQMENCGKIGGKILNEKLTFEQRSKGGKIGGKSQSKIEKQSKPILQFTKDGEFIKEWPSMIEAERQIRIAHSSICKCCKGKSKTAGGFIWAYKNKMA